MLDNFLEWVRYSPTPHVYIFLAILVLCGLYAIYLSFQTFYRKRLVEDLPTSRIHSAAQGYIELEGTAKLMDGTPIVAPYSGVRCAWYYFRVEERESNGKDTHWRTLNSGTSDDLFLLDDGTGECVIDPENAVVTPNSKESWYSSSMSSSPMFGTIPRAQRFQGSSGFNKYKYTEHRIEVGAPLHVIGFFHSLSGGEYVDINADVKELLREWKKDSIRLLERFDANGDGEIDMEEWQTARKTAYEEVLMRHQDLSLSLPTHMMEQTKDRRRPYILSAKPQSDFIKQLNQELLLKVGVSIILSIISVTLIQLRLASGI